MSDPYSLDYQAVSRRKLYHAAARGVNGRGWAAPRDSLPAASPGCYNAPANFRRKDAMKRIALVLVLAAALALSCSTGKSPTVPTSPVLYGDTFKIIDNPAVADTEIDFLVGFTDQDGDMADATLALIVETADGVTDPVALDDMDGGNANGIVIDGTTAGTIRFHLVALAAWDGATFTLTVTDDAGDVSNEVSETLDVDPATGK